MSSVNLDKPSVASVCRVSNPDFIIGCACVFIIGIIHLKNRLKTEPNPEPL